MTPARHSRAPQRPRAGVASKPSRTRAVVAAAGHAPSATGRSRATFEVALAALTIVVASLLVHANGFSGSFLFDDTRHIVQNPRIRDLWPPWATMTPPPNEGRPLIAFTLAVNYAFGGLNTWGYHAVNVAIHVLAALTLFGVVRRSASGLGGAGSVGMPEALAWTEAGATLVAWASALLFAVHPLQTESVTYVIQRSESLAGLLYLATIYGLIRSASPGAVRRWQALAVVACALGMATKQTMVTAPITALLYDRCFLAGSFRDALRQRRTLYIALASTWIILAALQVTSPNPGAGLGLNTTPWEYARSQPGVIAHYLGLAVWPAALCLDYDWPLASSAHEILPPAVLVAGLAGAGLWALRRRPAAGFLVAFFFLALAPTSSVLPISQVAAEHRMYLALAPLIVLAVGGGHLLSQHLGAWSRLTSGLVLGVAVLGAGTLTHARNHDYRSAVAMWRDVVAKAPRNAFAYNNLAYELRQAGGSPEEAIALLKQALALNPGSWHTYKNLGDAWFALGRYDEAAAAYRDSLLWQQGTTGRFEIVFNLALALIQTQQLAAAVPLLEEATTIDPSHPRPHATLGAVLLDLGDLDRAQHHLEFAVKVQPTASILSNLGALATARGRFDAAAGYYREALRLQPDSARAADGLRQVESLTK